MLREAAFIQRCLREVCVCVCVRVPAFAVMWDASDRSVHSEDTLQQIWALRWKVCHPVQWR